MTVATYASDCSTAKTTFNLQDTDKTVCAKISNAQPGWQVIWSSSAFIAVQSNTLTAADQSFTFTLNPASSLGDWRVIVYDPFGGSVQAVTSFIVIDAANPRADVSVSKGAISGSASSGSQVVFSVRVANSGPSAANTVVLSDSIPTNTSILYSFDQLAGPDFYVCQSGGWEHHR